MHLFCNRVVLCFDTTVNEIFKSIFCKEDAMAKKSIIQIIKQGKKRAQPNFMHPMLATLTTDYFSSPDWIYEHKFDGQRCLVIKKNGKVRLMSRNDREINNEYPELVKAFAEQEADNFIIDGEIVALKKGLSDFELLQSRINLKDASAHQKKLAPIVFCIFDLLYIDGFDITQVSLLERKQVLKQLLHYNRILLYTDHTVGDGLTFFKKACSFDWEGVIAKKSDSPYLGKRSTFWLKFKCIMQQELVIGGYTRPEGSRTDFGALLVGYYKGGKFHYAGKVGTGFSYETLALLGRKMRALEVKKTHFVDYDGSSQGVHWIKPKLVAEFQFAQWTKGGKLRVGRFKGLRSDKAAESVVKEVPKSIIIKK